MDIAVVIPVFCGEETIEELFEGIRETLENKYEFEVIFVHDGGTDLSWENICELKDIHGSLIRGIKLTQNFGQHNALLCGFQYTDATLIITMDEDLQHNPKDIINLIDCQKQNNADLVYGSYILRNHSILRNTASLLLRSVLTKTIRHLHKDFSSYRLLKNDVVKNINWTSSAYTFLDGSFAQLNIKVKSTVVQHFKSKVGKSSYSLTKLFKHAVNIIISFSELPIIFLQRTSMLLFLIFSLYSVSLLLRKLIITEFSLNNYSIFTVILGFGVGFGLYGLGIMLRKTKKKQNLPNPKAKYTVNEIR